MNCPICNAPLQVSLFEDSVECDKNKSHSIRYWKEFSTAVPYDALQSAVTLHQEDDYTVEFYEKEMFRFEGNKKENCIKVSKLLDDDSGWGLLFGYEREFVCELPFQKLNKETIERFKGIMKLQAFL
jgi:hypothetical protein